MKGTYNESIRINEASKKESLLSCEHGKEHDKWHNDITGKDFMIPRHGSKEIATGTANRILKDAGIK